MTFRFKARIDPLTWMVCHLHVVDFSNSSLSATPADHLEDIVKLLTHILYQAAIFCDFQSICLSIFTSCFCFGHRPVKYFVFVTGTK